MAATFDNDANRARAANGAWLSQFKPQPRDRELFQHEGRTVFRQRFNQLKLGVFHKMDQPLGDRFVVQSVLDIIGFRRFTDIEFHFQVDTDGLSDFPLPVENTDDGFYIQVFIKYSILANSVF